MCTSKDLNANSEMSLFEKVQKVTVRPSSSIVRPVKNHESVAENSLF